MLNRLSAYDDVIVAASPVNPVIGCVLIAKKCGGVMLAAESGVTERGQALNKIGTRRSGNGHGEKK